MDELRRLEAEFWKNPATAALSRSVNQTTAEIQKQAKREASRERRDNLTGHDEAAATGTQTMFLVFMDDQDHPEVVEIKDSSPSRIVVEAGLGVWRPSFVLQWSVFVEYGQIKIEQQMETSISLSGEGPHLDLLDWKHHYTDWKELKRIATHRWRSAEFSADELKSFPPFAVDEVKEQVRTLLKDYPEGLDHWLGLAETCRPPFDKACGIGTSRAVIRISRKNGAAWIENKRIEILIPMGC